MKSRSIYHINVKLQVKPFSYHAPQGAAVAVFHPSIGADKAKYTTGAEERKRSLNKGNVYICSIINGLKPAAVLGYKGVWYQFLAYIGRIANNVRKALLNWREEEISL